jgi:hypothetical protein
MGLGYRWSLPPHLHIDEIVAELEGAPADSASLSKSRSGEIMPALTAPPGR